MTRDQAAVKIDIDGRRAPSINEMTRLCRRAGYRIIAAMFDRSPSGKGWHVIVHVSPRPSSPFEVVALSLVLGSDVNREAMQLCRARAFKRVPMFMRDAWNVLYAPHPHRMRHFHLRRLDDEDERIYSLSSGTQRCATRVK